jgi:septal ring factor EnvC (AmiA/AmiB activator)
MSEDNRKRPCIIRVLPSVDARVRAYAARQGLAPNVAAEALINGAAGEIAALDAALVTLRAELESAREATRRADAALESSHRSNRILAGRADAAEAEVARLTREVAGERLKTEAAQAREQQARTEAADLQARRSSAAPCACALPDDFEAKLAERAPGWKGTPAELRTRVIQLGFSRYDALATDAAKRAAERGR